MLTKRTDLALEARELWQESAQRTTRLSGVKATKTKREGYPITRVDILDERGEEALGKPQGSYLTIDLTAYWKRKEDYFDRAVRAVGSHLKDLSLPDGPALVVGLGNRAMTPDAVGPLTLDTAGLQLYKNGDPIPLTPTEYKILAQLMASPGRIFTKVQLYEGIAGEYFESNDNTMMAHISKLREKIEDDPKNPRCIITIRGLGYKIEG